MVLLKKNRMTRVGKRKNKTTLTSYFFDIILSEYTRETIGQTRFRVLRDLVH